MLGEEGYSIKLNILLKFRKFLMLAVKLCIKNINFIEGM